MDKRCIFGVVDDIFIIIYFISTNVFRLQNFPAHKSILLKIISSIRIKNIIRERCFSFKLKVFIRASSLVLQHMEMYLKLITLLDEIFFEKGNIVLLFKNNPLKVYIFKCLGKGQCYKWMLKSFSITLARESDIL